MLLSWIAPLFLFGMCLGQHPTLLYFLILLPLPCLITPALRTQCPYVLRFSFLILLIGSVSAALQPMRATSHLRPSNVPVHIQGRVTDLPRVYSYQTNMTIQTEKVEGRWLREPLRLNVNTNQKIKIRAGERWLFTTFLHRDARHHSLVGEVSHAVRCMRQPGFWQAGLAQQRQRIQDSLKQLIAQNPYCGIIEALTLGNTSDISQAQWQVFRNTGTAHLVAISGLHIGLVSGLIFYLTNYLWRRSEFLLLFMAAPQVAGIAAWCAALLYSGLAGFNLPTQRALLMLGLFMIARHLRYYLPRQVILGLALTLILLHAPESLVSKSIWLSFSAVSLILYAVSGHAQHTAPRWKTWLRIQGCLSGGMMGFSLLYFQQATFLSAFANAVAIPAVGFITVPFSLLGVVLSYFWATAAQCSLDVATHSLRYLWPFLRALSTQSLFLWHPAPQAVYVLALFTVGMLLLFAPKGLKGRLFGLILLLPVGLGSR